ncbi:MAG: DUF2520 domain-containing protein [Bacteroidetes bacterium HGW-Bacteroidetes-17]|jgi:predicted short-subunit dehydrogenase-like oxidoreductase (DUF2520 family)|nr:MAG: DUF2520 domain-containing protein [Bacteroidetes bacterium HGW-Bacteroidetes-17]
MDSAEIHQIVILGSGNVATRLSIALQLAGLEIMQIFGRNVRDAKILAERLGVKHTDDLKAVIPSADLYLLCLSDDALTDVIGSFPFKNKLLVHTSGTISMDVFQNIQNNYGIFYPLQTLSKNKEIKFEGIPICIEANSKTNEAKLVRLAEKISNNIHLINSDQRKILHVAAVFASNFTNYFYSVSKEILESNQLSFDLLKPLIIETVEKALSQNPDETQTGPARRGDKKIISAHLEYLNSQSEFKEMYELISKHITHKYSKQ